MNNWHSEKQRELRAKSSESLQYIAFDALQAALEGETIGNPKTGQYWDEYHYCCLELRKRGGK